MVSLRDTIDNLDFATAVSDEERDWIRARIIEVTEAMAHLHWPLGTGLIHGDASAGNLLPRDGPDADGVVLSDWDWVSFGPREVDLIPTWHAAHRYGRGTSWTQAFANRYGYDLAIWEGYPTLFAMRDLVQLTGPIRRAGSAPQYRAALRQRLADLCSGDTVTVWTAL